MAAEDPRPKATIIIEHGGKRQTISGRLEDFQFEIEVAEEPQLETGEVIRVPGESETWTLKFDATTIKKEPSTDD